MKKVIVIGSGGHAKVVIDILHEMKEFDIIGITSNSYPNQSVFFGLPIIGDDTIFGKEEYRDCLVAMGLGGFKDNLLREEVYNNVKSKGFTFVNAIHPSAIISKTVKFEEGVVVFPGVVLNTDVKIGSNSIIATGSTIDHETIIGNHVLISAGVTVGAYSVIKDRALLALGSKVVSGITIGQNSLIAAGAVVVYNVEDNQSVFGIPAKRKGTE